VADRRRESQRRLAVPSALWLAGSLPVLKGFDKGLDDPIHAILVRRISVLGAVQNP